MKALLSGLKAGLVSISIVLLLASSVSATDDRFRLGLGAGIFDAFDHMNILTGSMTFEFRPFTNCWNLRPAVQGIAIDESGYYVGLGALKEFTLGSTWSWGLGFSAGLAHESDERVLTRFYGHFKKAYSGHKECLCRREESSVPNLNAELLNKHARPA